MGGEQRKYSQIFRIGDGNYEKALYFWTMSTQWVCCNEEDNKNILEGSRHTPLHIFQNIYFNSI